MKNKILLGVLTATVGLGGIVYAGGNKIDPSTSSVDYRLESRQAAGSRLEGHRDFKETDTYRTCYGLGRHHRKLTDAEIKDLRENSNFDHHLGMTKEEYARLSKAEKRDLLARVKENRNLSDREVEKLIGSGDYCHYFDMTREEYEKLTDKELKDLFDKNEYSGYRNQDRKDSETRDFYRRKSHHNRGGHETRPRRVRGHGPCH